jgi:hypothetical protein
LDADLGLVVGTIALLALHVCEGTIRTKALECMLVGTKTSSTALVDDTLPPVFLDFHRHAVHELWVFCEEMPADDGPKLLNGSEIVHLAQAVHSIFASISSHDGFVVTCAVHITHDLAFQQDLHCDLHHLLEAVFVANNLDHAYTAFAMAVESKVHSRSRHDVYSARKKSKTLSGRIFYNFYQYKVFLEVESGGGAGHMR